MHILANGCSNTWGAGLGYEDIPELPIHGKAVNDASRALHQQRVNQTWPGQLAQNLGAESVTNLGISCGSNQRIIRTTLEWCLQQTPEKLKNTVALIQWTHSMRYEYYVPKKDSIWSFLTTPTECPPINNISIDPNRWAKVKTGVRIGLPNEPKTLLRWPLEEVAQARYLLWTPEEGIYRDIECYSSLDSIFRGFGIKYFYWHYIGYNLNPSLEEWATHTFNWVDPTNPSTKGWEFDRLPCSHPSVQGHQEIAKRIFDLIKTRL